MNRTKSYRHNLSKSRYVEGIRCQKQLWLRYHRQELAAVPSIAERRTMDEGTRVGVHARETLYPGGILIQQMGEAALQATEEALRLDPPAIFEATFYYQGVLVMCDLLVNNFDGSWDIVEVKASTRLKPEYIHDIAIQTFVVAGAGLPVARQRLLLIDNSAVVDGDLSGLFVDHDVTAEIEAIVADVPATVADFHQLLEQKDEPDLPIGNHCQKPHLCPFKNHCWRDVPEPSIFSIPRLKGQDKTALAARGVIELTDLPVDFPLGLSQQTAVQLMLDQREEIDHQALRKRLQTLVYPIYFFDFETDAAAIPHHRGLRAYEAVPFQYSCHILHQDDTLEHVEYLHTDQSDPRNQLLGSLLNHVGPTGSVVVYNASFERSVLRKLALMAPEHEEAIQSIIDRLWDQLDLFKNHYKSYRFGGSNSIKKVLPVVAPHLTYSTLNVSRGDEAQAVWNQMIRLPQCDEKEQLIDDLLAYCKLDTLAMVEIQRHLEKICRMEESCLQVA